MGRAVGPSPGVQELTFQREADLTFLIARIAVSVDVSALLTLYRRPAWRKCSLRSGRIDRRDFDVQRLQCDQAFSRASASNYVRRSDVMNDAIHPCAKRTAMVERCHTPPKFDMHLLQQVGPAVGVRLIGAGKPARESPAEAVRLFVQCALLAAIHRLPGTLL
jgi:hypothetical protein